MEKTLLTFLSNEEVGKHYKRIELQNVIEFNGYGMYLPLGLEFCLTEVRDPHRSQCISKLYTIYC